MSDDKFEFRVGDKVKWGEEVGEVTAIKPDGPYPVFVDFGGPFIFGACFTNGGLYDKNLPKSPRLEFVARPKKKIKKRYWRWKLREADGYWFKGSDYRNEAGEDTRGRAYEYYYSTLWASLEKIKIEDDYVEIEVEE